MICFSIRERLRRSASSRGLASVGSVLASWSVTACDSSAGDLVGAEGRPAFVSPSAEALEGTVDVMIHDDIDGFVEEHVFLELATHDRLRLAFASHEARSRSLTAEGTLSTGAAVRVFGTHVGTQFLVEHLEVLARASTPSSVDFRATGVERQAFNQPIGLGDHSVAIVLVGFASTPNTYDAEQMRQAVYGSGRSTNTFYLAGSFGGSRLVGIEDVEGGDVLGPYTVSGNGCENGYDAAGTQARNMARDDGHDIDAYEKIVHYLPPNAPGCPGGGVGGGRYAFIFGVGIDAAWDYIAHEVGHTFGLPHAGSFTDCTQGSEVITYTGNCGQEEYGDLTDIMGGRNFQFSSHHLDRLGWLPPGNEVTLAQSARVRLAPIEIASTGVQSLYVNREGNENFHLEFRRPLNVDESLEAGFTDGVLIRITNGGATTRLLDMTPGDSFNDAALRPGRTFQDSGVEITVVEVTSEAAIVDIVIDGEPVDPSNVVGGEETDTGDDATESESGLVDGSTGASSDAGDDPATTGEDGTEQPGEGSESTDTTTTRGDEETSGHDTGVDDDSNSASGSDATGDSTAESTGGSSSDGSSEMDGSASVASAEAPSPAAGCACSLEPSGGPRAPASSWLASVALLGLWMRRRHLRTGGSV